VAAFYSRGRAGTGLHAFTMKHKGARKGGPTTVGTCAPGRRIARLGPAWARYTWRAAGQGLGGGPGEDVVHEWPCGISASGPGGPWRTGRRVGRRARRRLGVPERLGAAVNATLTVICSKFLN
jgi:hypothetical protein